MADRGMDHCTAEPPGSQVAVPGRANGIRRATSKMPKSAGQQCRRRTRLYTRGRAEGVKRGALALLNREDGVCPLVF